MDYFDEEEHRVKVEMDVYGEPARPLYIPVWVYLGVIGTGMIIIGILL